MLKNDSDERKCVICGDPIDGGHESDSWVGSSPSQLQPLLHALDRELSKAHVFIRLPVFWIPNGTVMLKFEDVDDCEKLLNIVSEPDEDPESIYNCIRHYSDESDYWMFDFEYDDLGIEIDDDGNERPGESSPDFHAFPYVSFPDRHLPKVIERLKA